jgi:hypothetical protein
MVHLTSSKEVSTVATAGFRKFLTDVHNICQKRLFFRRQKAIKSPRLDVYSYFIAAYLSPEISIVSL